MCAFKCSPMLYKVSVEVEGGAEKDEEHLDVGVFMSFFVLY